MIHISCSKKQDLKSFHLRKGIPNGVISAIFIKYALCHFLYFCVVDEVLREAADLPLPNPHVNPIIPAKNAHRRPTRQPVSAID